MIQSVDFLHLRSKHEHKTQVTYLRHRKNEPEPLVREDGTLITIANVDDGQCRWMGGEQCGAFIPLCGHKADHGSYCDYHRGRAYQKNSVNAR